MSDSRLNALNPKLVPLSLFPLTIAERILPGLVHPSDGNTVAVLGAAAKAFSVLQQVLVLQKDKMTK